MRKEAVMDQFKVKGRNLSGGTEEYHGGFSQVYRCFGPDSNMPSSENANKAEALPFKSQFAEYH